MENVVRNYIYRILCLIFSLINQIVPKSNIVIFNSFPAFSDNSWELYCYMHKYRKDIFKKYKIFWGINTADVIPKYADQVGINILKKKTIKGIWMFLRAKYIVTTHGYFGGVKSGRGQIQINLWHGCGYKDITNHDRTFIGDYTIATSEFYSHIQARVFDLPLNKVLVTGLPRNDLLFNKIYCLRTIGIEKEKYKKILIWMPTYRKAAFGHSGIDGSTNSFGLSSLTDNDFILLNNALYKENYLLIIKTHPMDTFKYEDNKALSNIVSITTDELLDKGVRLYSLFSETDALLSDYSSVIVDYLLLDKPIAMVLSDINEYKNSRGFVFDDVRSYFPGPIIGDISALINYINNFDKINQNWINHRKQLTKTFHSHIDNNSCKRVYDYFWNIK